MNWKEFEENGLIIFRAIILTISWRDLGKPWETYVRIVSITTEIRTVWSNFLRHKSLSDANIRDRKKKAFTTRKQINLASLSERMSWGNDSFFLFLFLISFLEGRSLLVTITSVIKLNFCHYSSILHSNLIALIKTSGYTGSVGDAEASKIKTVIAVPHDAPALLGFPELWRVELLTVAAHTTPCNLFI